MAPRDRAARWSECARAADSGGEHRSTRIHAIRTRGVQTRGPREACFVGWIGVRHPPTRLRQSPKRSNRVAMQTERLVPDYPHPQDHPALGQIGSVCAAAYGGAWRLSRQPVNPGQGVDGQ